MVKKKKSTSLLKFSVHTYHFFHFFCFGKNNNIRCGRCLIYLTCLLSKLDFIVYLPTHFFQKQTSHWHHHLSSLQSVKAFSYCKDNKQSTLFNSISISSFTSISSSYFPSMLILMNTSSFLHVVLTFWYDGKNKMDFKKLVTINKSKTWT